MKKILTLAGLTALIFFFSLAFLSPLIGTLGYTSVESSYHQLTHALLVALIFLVLMSTLLVLEEIKEVREGLGDREKKNSPR
jgi:polyferredoxin